MTENLEDPLELLEIGEAALLFQKLCADAERELLSLFAAESDPHHCSNPHCRGPEAHK